MTLSLVAQEQKGLAEHIVKKLYNRTSGRGARECTRNYPRDIFFVGNLRSEEGG